MGTSSAIATSIAYGAATDEKKYEGDKGQPKTCQITILEGKSQGEKGVDEPAPVFVVIPAPSVLNSFLMSARSAISMQNATRVKKVAKNAIHDEIMPIVDFIENRAKKNAKNAAMVATHEI